MSSGNLLGVFIFGSVGRGDFDRSSDLDILAVVESGAGRVDDDQVIAHLTDDQRAMSPEISWYGCDRLMGMFRAGELFAWHLFQDAIAVHDPDLVLESLGSPAPYRDASDDIRSFRELLIGVPANIAASPWNATYEAGLLYICARNIAMSATAALLDRPDFSRNSPFRLADLEPFPLSEAEYYRLMSCRLAGQRGGDVPRFRTVDEVLTMHQQVQGWADRILTRVERQEANESRPEAVAF